MHKDNRSTTPSIAFVIPARNEEGHIERSLGSISEQMRGATFPFEVVVIDNGSTDRTKALAEAAGASVRVQRDGTIGALRNLGADLSSGDIIVFLDADVELTPRWKRSLPAAVHQLLGAPIIITGSNCTSPKDGTWLERYWFDAATQAPIASHIGTAHMILTRSAFEAIGKFDGTYATGEDYEFCSRAKRLGGLIVLNQDLEVVHHDYPKTLTNFIRREAWHGQGDVKTLRDAAGSRVIRATIVFLILHVALLGGLLLRSVTTVVSAAALLVGLLSASSWFKYRGTTTRLILINAGVFYFYYLGRAISIARAITGRSR